ncbi:MAG TPA: aldehyde dehydrogenase family protein [Myxococcota bacterium]|nr:aldehyde dehydrogenase family protein [Myxococcota bacterium]
MSHVLRSFSPADPRDEIGTFAVADEAAVHRAVVRARAAFPAWRDAGLASREKVLRRFAAVVKNRSDVLAQLLAREVGKALWDARAEVALLPAKVDVTLSEGMRVVAPIEAGAGARAFFNPRGVLAVLGPFNFPAHLPNGHIVPALAMGNTVVWKPSELAPAVAHWVEEAWREAGLPPGVLEVVHGPAQTGQFVALHPEVDAILFTGSWAVGRKLASQVLDQPWKLVALELGGKNAIIVLRDADLSLAVAEAAVSICATTGQRCSSASRIFVEKPVFDAFTERLARVLRGVRVGPPLEPGVFMGPLVSHAAHAKVLGYRALAKEAGGERVVDVEPTLPSPFIGPGLVRFTDTRQDHAYQRDEIFGPEAALYPVDSLEHAIAAVNDSDFGLVASIMTADRAQFTYCMGRVRTGLLNWNRGTIGASGRLPFGGTKRSGNDRPAGILSALYCSVAQAYLEHAGGFDPAALPPGMPPP